MGPTCLKLRFSPKADVSSDILLCCISLLGLLACNRVDQWTAYETT